MYKQTYLNIYKLCFSYSNMKKRIKKWGNSLVVVFTSEDEKIFGLQEGDIIDIDDMLFTINTNKKLKKKEE